MSFTITCNKCNNIEIVSLKKKTEEVLDSVNTSYYFDINNFEIDNSSYNGDIKIECLNCNNEIETDVIGEFEEID
jgi:ribosomal protein S27E